MLSAAAPFKSGGRGGPDYYTDVPAGADRDQERRRPLSLPQHVQAVAITGAQVQGMAGEVGRHLQPGRRRAGADQPLIDPTSRPTISTSIDGVTYTIDVTQPPKYDADGELRRTRTPAASST